MSTSCERREVAERLREAWPEAGGMEEVWEVLDPILGTHDGPDVYKAWEQTFNRLADLIDPTCHIAPDDLASEQCMGPMLSCDRCGAAFPPINDDYNYCPNCGARVVGD